MPDTEITNEKLQQRMDEAIEALEAAVRTVCGAAESIERSRLTAVEAWDAAHRALTDATAAKTLVEEVKAASESASSVAASAKEAADAANVKASAIETTAQAASLTAQSALSTANAAKTAADAANGKAGQAQIAASNAQTAASGAQTTASEAKTAAAKAVVKTGARGDLAGYETASSVSGSQTININSPDCLNIAASGVVTLTFQTAAANIRAIKSICLTATAATLLQISGAVWANNGSAPAWGNAGKVLFLAAAFVGGRVMLSVADNTQ